MTERSTSDLEQPLRIWTDYQRMNETFFWSDTAQTWWSGLNENQLGVFIAVNDRTDFELRFKP